MSHTKRIDYLVKEISKLTGIKTESESERDSEGKYLNKFLFVEYDSCYRGYHLSICGSNGNSGASNFDHRQLPMLKGKEFVKYLEGVLFGLEYRKENK